MPAVRRLGLLAIAIVLIVATIPPLCTTSCCALSGAAARMMASMGCCGGSAKIHSDLTTPESPEATLASSTHVAPRADAVLLVTTAAQSTLVASSLRVSPGQLDDRAGAPPPIFLRDAQFRI